MADHIYRVLVVENPKWWLRDNVMGTTVAMGGSIALCLLSSFPGNGWNHSDGKATKPGVALVSLSHGKTHKTWTGSRVEWSRVEWSAHSLGGVDGKALNHGNPIKLKTHSQHSQTLNRQHNHTW